MTENTTGSLPDSVELTSDIVSAYISNNPVPAAGLANLIGAVHAAVANLSRGAMQSAPVEGKFEKSSADQIRKSVTDDGIVSFIDGKTYKTLKRHLTTHGLNPRSYRERYGLPGDYPMVASSYAAARSALAKQIGLGRPRALADREATSAKGKRHKSP